MAGRGNSSAAWTLDELDCRFCAAGMRIRRGTSLDWNMLANCLRCAGRIYIVLLPLVFGMTIINVNPSNRYLRQYNERLERIATEAGLVGMPKNE